MKQLQLPKMSTDKPAVRSNSSDTEACCNHLQQKFNQKAPNLVWVSDITYIKAGGIWYYLCIVMDLFSRKVISWHISSKANVELVITAFKKAYEKRNAPYGLMFHSDRGSQYTAFTFRRLLDSLNVVQSFSKKGYPFDNACCECFFKYLKKEETNRKCYRSLTELQLSVFEYIEVDHFKKINDTLGHAEGDCCLYLVANKIFAVYGKDGSCYRIGGDEYCVILHKNLDRINSLNAKFSESVRTLRDSYENIFGVSVGVPIMIKTKMMPKRF